MGDGRDRCLTRNIVTPASINRTLREGNLAPQPMFIAVEPPEKQGGTITTACSCPTIRQDNRIYDDTKVLNIRIAIATLVHVGIATLYDIFATVPSGRPLEIEVKLVFVMVWGVDSEAVHPQSIARPLSPRL
jgi:hypothetical protein